MWCVAKLDDEYIERMTDIITLSEQPYDEKLPVVCMDEKLIELRQEVRPLQRVKGVLRRDYEYRRNGTANMFMMTEPKGGKHYVRVTERRTAKDFAYALKNLAGRYPEALTIHLVLDNLNTHCEKSLIETFGIEQGRRRWARFTVHFTPKHGSWLNQAELALSVTRRACLQNRRIDSIASLRALVVPFWRVRRRKRWTIQWRWSIAHMKQWLKANGTEH